MPSSLNNPRLYWTKKEKRNGKKGALKKKHQTKQNTKHTPRKPWFYFPLFAILKIFLKQNRKGLWSVFKQSPAFKNANKYNQSPSQNWSAALNELVLDTNSMSPQEISSLLLVTEMLNKQMTKSVLTQANGFINTDKTPLFHNTLHSILL